MASPIPYTVSWTSSQDGQGDLVIVWTVKDASGTQVAQWTDTWNNTAKAQQIFSQLQTKLAGLLSTLPAAGGTLPASGSFQIGLPATMRFLETY
jgi:hypothetical protein